MNKSTPNNTSLTDWERLDALTDDEIDISDIPPLDDDFFANAVLIFGDDLQNRPTG